MLKKRTNKMAKSKPKTSASKSSASGSTRGDREGDLQHLERIFELMEKHEVAELEWERSGDRLKLKTRYASPEQLLIPSASLGSQASFSYHRAPNENLSSLGRDSGQNAGSASSSSAPAAPVKSPVQNSTQKQVVSPFVGTFYRAPSPESDSYVREGQSVKRGDVLCIIEAMKLMNEIEAEFPGKIVSVLVENGQPVEFGEPLFVIEP
jgi:acetyl-CoA carboxylase biotin carboxyl carrier protein